MILLFICIENFGRFFLNSSQGLRFICMITRFSVAEAKVP